MGSKSRSTSRMLLFHGRVRTDSVTRTVKNGHTDIFEADPVLSRAFYRAYDIRDPTFEA